MADKKEKTEEATWDLDRPIVKAIGRIWVRNRKSDR